MVSRTISGLTVALMLVAAGCGGDDEDGAAPDATPSGTGTPMADETPGETEPPPAEQTEPVDEPSAEPSEPDDDGQVEESSTVGIAETSLGTILVDADGMTLYIFDPDEQGASTCSGDCAANWPPLIVDGEPVAGESVDGSLLGTTERDDGSAQATYDGWPLYLWAQDDAPEDVTGQGVNEVWWVIGPDGTPIRE